MLELEQLRAGYGTGEVLKGVSLTVHEGEIVTLLGANGAGKTTTLLTITGVLKARGGDIRWKGKSLLGLSPEEILRAGVCLCPEGRHIFPHLSVEENLRVGGVTRSTTTEKQRLDEVFDLFPILLERRTQLGGTLSGGEQQMLAIARARMSEAPLLMLDEPSLGLAPVITLRIFEMIQRINRQGTTVLLVEQNAQQALRVAHRGYVMVTGKVMFEDTAAHLLESDQVRRAYLGEM